jgi:hypothetical protein
MLQRKNSATLREIGMEGRTVLDSWRRMDALPVLGATDNSRFIVCQLANEAGDEANLRRRLGLRPDTTPIAFYDIYPEMDCQRFSSPAPDRTLKTAIPQSYDSHTHWELMVRFVFKGDQCKYSRSATISQIKKLNSLSQ